MSYCEHAPPDLLAPWLECIWERSGDGAPVLVLPDGCTDVVWTEGRETLLVGANTTAFTVPLQPGARVVGARFRPGAGPALLGFAAEELRDVRVAIDELWGAEGKRLAAILDASTDTAQTLTAWLLQCTSNGAEPPDPLAREAILQLEADPLSVAEIAERLAISERQLRRRVVTAVGYGPKRLARVFRLHRALDAARNGLELGEVAFDAGYADQAHFTNECRELAGIPPSMLLAA